METTNDLIISRTYEDRLSQELPVYQPDQDELDRINTVKKTWTDSDSRNKVLHRTWFVNGAFVRGQHYVAFNPGTQSFEVPFKVPAHRVRLAINYIFAYFRRTKSRLTANKPGMFVRPATVDMEDVERARLGSKCLESEQYRLGFQGRLRGTVGYALECGSGIMYLGWNPRIGTPLMEERPVLDEYGQPSVDPETGQPVTERVPMVDEQGNQVFSGENELCIVSPYEFDCDPAATTMDDAEWVRRSKIRSLRWIRENYPQKGVFVKKEAVEGHTFFQRRMQKLVGQMGYSSDSESTSVELGDTPSAVVHEYWERATVKYPRGRLIVIAGNVELYNGENPYNHKLFPFIKVDEIAIPGRFWGMAVIEQLVPLQKNLNRARSQEVENRTLMGRPKWLVPRTAKVKQGSFDAEAGEKVDYTPGPRGERPETIYPASTSPATQAEIGHTLSDMQEVGAWHEASKGSMPSANAPAEAVKLLQQADDTSLGDTANNIDEALVRLGRMILSNCAQFWDEQRLVRAGGEGSKLEAMKVRGSDLVGPNQDADYFDVRVLPGSTLNRDPAAQRQKVAELLQLGILNPIAHRDTILKMLDIADIELAFEDERQDEQWAEMENEMMSRGVFSLPRDFENHDLHLAVLDRYRKSEKYRRADPRLQAVFDEHAQIHKQLAVTSAQEKIMLQAMAQNILPNAGGEEAESTNEGGEQGKSSQSED